MIDKKQIVNMAKKSGLVTSSEVAGTFNVSRQYASRMLAELVNDGLLVKFGSTRSARYVPVTAKSGAKPKAQFRYVKKLPRKNIEEHVVLADIKQNFTQLNTLPENVRSIFDYAFLEMLNNAIEHSKSKNISIEVLLADGELKFVVSDAGIGVFRNIMQGKGLNSEQDAIGELLKGKVTTAPALHSGEGIFFTSKAGDKFYLESFGWQMIADNLVPDVFVGETTGTKKGTRVSFSINVKTSRHLNDVFKNYSTSLDDSAAEFDKTEIRVNLFALGGVYISRSQARRILSGLDKFKLIVMNYEKVPMVGQAFADEVYRVFKNAHPEIQIENIGMNDAVNFMVSRAINAQKQNLD